MIAKNLKWQSERNYISVTLTGIYKTILGDIMGPTHHHKKVIYSPFLNTKVL